MMSMTRILGGVIALLSGGYSAWMAVSMMAAMEPLSWAMAILGAVVSAHGAVLLWPGADAGGMAMGTNGALMVVWAILMLGLQGWMALAMARAADVVMVVLAVLMLVSGFAMARAPEARRRRDRVERKA